MSTPAPRCPACGEPALDPWRTASSSDARLSAERSYRLQRCRSCGSAVLAERRSESPELYSEGTYGRVPRLSAALLAPLRRLVDWDRRRLVGALAPGSRVLEIGAGEGRLVGSLAAGGHAALGIEPAERAAAEARRHGAQVETVALEQAEFETGSFDVVVLWHVLEHLDDPSAALSRARAWLAPGGRAVVAVPNLASLQARIGGDRWFHQDIPRHHTQFTVSGLQRLLARSGFQPGRARHLLIDQNPLGMWSSLLNRVTKAPDAPYRLLKSSLHYERRRDALQDAALTLILGPVLVPVALLLELAAGLLGRGGSVVIHAAPMRGAERRLPGSGPT